MRTLARQLARELGHLRPAQLTPLMIGALVARWRTRHRPSTVRNYTNQLKRALRLLEFSGAPHITLPRVPRPKARGIVATVDEMTRLLKEPPPWLRLFMLLYFQCGMRFSETLRVTPASWDRAEHTATILVKGGRQRITPLTPDVEILLHSAGDPDPSTPFIWALKGRVMSADALRRAWQVHKKKCGVNAAVTAHDLRRTAAKIVLATTKDLRAVQALLGHQNLVSTLAYIPPLQPDEARRYQELLRFEHFKSETKQ